MAKIGLLGALLIMLVGCIATEQRVPETLDSAVPATLVLSCTTDADCVVKNIGNCCGYFPACLNKNSPTSPDLVLAQCERDQQMAQCGHPMIYGCRCESGFCRVDPEAGLDEPVDY